MQTILPEISVIVPAYNSENTISKCLDGLVNQTISREKYEIIVVDDASNDNTRTVVQSYSLIRYIRIPHGGPSAARNAGAKAAVSNILLFTDSDCIPSRDWIQNMTAPFQNNEVVGVKGAYRTHQHEFVSRFVQLEYESKYERMQKQQYIDFIDTNSAAYRKDIFLENGGFDINFPVASVEDQEFSFRLARKGYCMVFVPSAIVYHQHDRNITEYIHRKFVIGVWKARMLRWLPEKMLTDSHTPSSEKWQIVLLAFFILFSLLSIIRPILIWFSVLSIFLFFLTTIPFLFLIYRRDRSLLFPAFLPLLLRAVSLGSGLLSGLFFSHSISKKNHALSINQWIIKRSLDILISFIGLIILFPLFILISIAIILDSTGPILFFQERAGENGRAFKLVKFRTMINGADKILSHYINIDDLEEPVFKIQNDPRITKLGKFLRRWSLDELPQLWNIFRGDMSLVGPRPEETWLVARYNDTQRQRLAFKPGLTGPMQVNGRGELNMSDRLTLELEYIHNYSLKKDLAILFESIPAIIHGKGAF